MFVYIIQNVPAVTKEFKKEDMFADMIEIEALSDLAPGKKVSICGYVRKVCTFTFFFVYKILYYTYIL